MPADAPAISLDQLESEIGELAAHLSAATCRWLGLVGEFDAREGWGASGCKSCAHWLSWRCALSPAAAREHLRVARCLRDLPAIRETFGRGELSYSQVRALTRVATPETENDLVRVARYATAAQLEVVVRAYRGVLERELGESDPEHSRRFVRCEHDIDGALLITARLPAEEGALVMAALDTGRDAVRASARASAETTQTGDSTDALVPMADTMLASGSFHTPRRSTRTSGPILSMHASRQRELVASRRRPQRNALARCPDACLVTHHVAVLPHHDRRDVFEHH